MRVFHSDKEPFTASVRPRALDRRFSNSEKSFSRSVTFPHSDALHSVLPSVTLRERVASIVEWEKTFISVTTFAMTELLLTIAAEQFSAISVKAASVRLECVSKPSRTCRYAEVTEWLRLFKLALAAAFFSRDSRVRRVMLVDATERLEPLDLIHCVRVARVEEVHTMCRLYQRSCESVFLCLYGLVETLSAAASTFLCDRTFVESVYFQVKGVVESAPLPLSLLLHSCTSSHTAINTLAYF
jgi:hypothetical protein